MTQTAHNFSLVTRALLSGHDQSDDLVRSLSLFNKTRIVISTYLNYEIINGVNGPLFPRHLLQYKLRFHIINGLIPILSSMSFITMGMWPLIARWTANQQDRAIESVLFRTPVLGVRTHLTILGSKRIETDCFISCMNIRNEQTTKVLIACSIYTQFAQRIVFTMDDTFKTTINHHECGLCIMVTSMIYPRVIILDSCHVSLIHLAAKIICVLPSKRFRLFIKQLCHCCIHNLRFRTRRLTTKISIFGTDV